MSKRLDRKIAAVAAMDSTALGEEWKNLFDTAMPSWPSALLVRAMTWQIQEKALGGVTASLMRRMRRAMDAGEKSVVPAELRHGTKLVRSWHGRTLCVTVMDNGLFEMEGRQYRSLTHIAREVTGAAWSGPRFFGLVTRSGR